MKTIKTSFESKFEVKGSIFLSFLIPYDEFESKLNYLKKEHKKAKHFVYAYRKLGIQIMERFSDDNEPKGSSGIPILNVLRGENLVNIAFIVVRYFGGTLLGVGGLVRAYTQSALMSLELAKAQNALFEAEEFETHYFECDYSFVSKVEYLAQKYQVEIQKIDFLTSSIYISLYGGLANLKIIIDECGYNLKFIRSENAK